MRYYFVGPEGKEELVDIVACHRLATKTFRFQLKHGQKDFDLYMREMAGEFFTSFDGKVWDKTPAWGDASSVVQVSDVYQIFRGFKPSGLSEGSQGELLTQMPGKVVKINVSEGDEVDIGDTLVILEAMKMENEIKSAVKGKVEKIHVNEGDALDQGVVMLEVAPE